LSRPTDAGSTRATPASALMPFPRGRALPRRSASPRLWSRRRRREPSGAGRPRASACRAGLPITSTAVPTGSRAATSCATARALVSTSPPPTGRRAGPSRWCGGRAGAATTPCSGRRRRAAGAARADGATAAMTVVVLRPGLGCIERGQPAVRCRGSRVAGPECSAAIGAASVGRSLVRTARPTALGGRRRRAGPGRGRRAGRRGSRGSRRPCRCAASRSCGPAGLARFSAWLPARRSASRTQLGSSHTWCITTVLGGSGPWKAVHRTREARTVRPPALKRPWPASAIAPIQ